MNAYAVVCVPPVGAGLPRRVDRNFIREVAARRDTAGATISGCMWPFWGEECLPLRHADGAVVPRRRIKEHAVVMDRGIFGKRVVGVNNEVVILVHVNRWRSG